MTTLGKVVDLKQDKYHFHSLYHSHYCIASRINIYHHSPVIFITSYGHSKVALNRHTLYTAKQPDFLLAIPCAFTLTPSFFIMAWCFLLIVPSLLYTYHVSIYFPVPTFLLLPLNSFKTPVHSLPVSHSFNIQTICGCSPQSFKCAACIYHVRFSFLTQLWYLIPIAQPS